ncbi:hypothetical protein NQ314_005708 [Rhamnusium bicolor]|uniref:CUB domain-containing protein n=1 Tax=Rhamnusium bicolor TaxID=1586634 RepID=A0AAV8ZGA9_9CUCU|nr:hypothetical protein NQ314_005708 [Rhamnusium bicolor]
MFRTLFIIFFMKCAHCGFFDMMDVDDPLALLWNSKPSDPKFSECKVNTQSGIKYGVCTPYSHCKVSRGVPNGFCGILSTCCIFEKTCGKTSNTKVGYFEGTDVKNGASTCSYVVKLKNTNICQVRLDFVKFNLAPATLITNIQQRRVYKCIDDRLRIHPNHYNIPDLCGNNDNQHVYIHVDQSVGVTKGVQLDITLADRTLNPLLQQPSWKIKVTQLECPGKKAAFNIPSEDYIQDFSLLGKLVLGIVPRI